MRHRNLAVWLIVPWMWAAIGYASETSVASGPESRLWRLAEQEQSALEARGVVLCDASLSEYLQEVVGRLWNQVPTRLDAPTVKVIKDTRIDAYAYPNGRCVLSTGMLDVLENESQLAMILSHEMVHYARQHTTALYNHFQQAARRGDRQGNGKDAVAVKRSVLHTIEAAEREADSEGLSILGAAGYCEGEVLPLMSNLIKRMPEHGHPESVGELEDRAAFFRQRIGQGPGRRPAAASSDTDPDGYLAGIAPALLANTEVALRRGEWHQAERSISRFLALNPANAHAYYLKGETMRRQNAGDSGNHCIGSYQKALTIDPDFSPAHRALGELHYKAGRYQMAKPHFESFLSLAPRDHAGDYIRGYLRQCSN
ncbi:hypothetical protein DSCA_15220 [Desulfosarcina alkanivorans]|uniref:Peptidase M48 domain-containing protein n=1 Tax=Desulfosarcina alkanivorans TaxID=571177 RepID=A0A5K7YDM3_9BACT|nr:M48 family metalloprotease [Desulfosarcina alkanivorans]BBO67592.1 hypothetical protein DSCA_15220 [Desulfosarcina alkanivorans]